MANIRVLGLDDDNHSPMFIEENGSIYGDAQDLIKMLSQPHDNQYEVKMFALVDEWSDELSQYDECEVDNMFDFLCGRSKLAKGTKFIEIFDMFWESANRRYW